MKTHELIQGDANWHAHRDQYDNASEAPGVMDVSSYKKRRELLYETHTGIKPEISAILQDMFADGHRFEALARPLAEEIIGEELSPVTGTNGKYGASFDGITFDGSVIFEHKTLKKEIEAATDISELALEYKVQMEHQLMVSGASKCLFMASKWDKSNVLIDMKWFWYMPDLALRERIVGAWAQWHKDLAAYVPPKATVEAIGKTPESLPALRIEITGMVTASNLAEFKETALAVLNGINTNLQTDQDFADAEKSVKFCKDAEERLDAAKQHALSQTASIDELFRTIDSIKKASSEVRLKLDKLVKSEKENRKAEIVSKAGIAFTAHIESLEAETRPIQLNVQRPDFGGAMRSMKKLSAMQDAVDTALRNGMFEADSVAKNIRGKLAWHKANAGSHDFLFRDLQTIIYKVDDDFKLLVNSRIATHTAAEAEKIESQRATIRAEIRAEVSSEKQTQISAETEQVIAKTVVQNQGQGVAQKNSRPSDDEIIDAISINFRVHESVVIGWLLEIDLESASKRLIGEFAA